MGQLRSGGLERQLYFLLSGLNRDRYKPEVVVWSYCEDDTYVAQIRKLGIPIHGISPALPGPIKVLVFRRLVKQLRPKVIHSYSFFTNFAAWWATIGRDSIAIGAVQSDFVRDKHFPGPCLGRLSARWPRTQIFNNFAAAETAGRCRSPFVPKSRIVVQNGLDLESFRDTPPPVEARVQILGVGSLLPVKRWDRLMLAALELKSNGVKCLIRIAGDGPLRKTLEHQAQDLGVTDYVQFLGHADNVPALLAASSFLVHTSDTEGCPNVIMEAMACGRAVVATDAGDVPYLIEDSKTGFVVKRGDDATLVKRMRSLINDRELCRRMGQAGRAKAAREFGLHRLVSETLSAYQAAGWNDERVRGAEL